MSQSAQLYRKWSKSTKTEKWLYCIISGNHSNNMQAYLIRST